MNCTKAIIPVAGWGTRRLPITKAIEKCMLPIGNRPIIDYVVENCITGGITDIFFVVSPDFEQLKKYYSTNVALEEYLAARGKTDMLSELQAIPRKANFHYIIQDPDGPYGTAVPVWVARDAVDKDELFAVLLGDYFIFRPHNRLSELGAMKQAVTDSGSAGALLTVEVGDAELDSCGILAIKPAPGGQEYLQRIVEKPGLAQAPSHLANVSNYLFDTDIFPHLEAILEHPNESGEHYLTDAVNRYAAAGKNMAVVHSDGIPLDGGNLKGWVEANNIIMQHIGRHNQVY